MTQNHQPVQRVEYAPLSDDHPFVCLCTSHIGAILELAGRPPTVLELSISSLREGMMLALAAPEWAASICQESQPAAQFAEDLAALRNFAHAHPVTAVQGDD